MSSQTLTTVDEAVRAHAADKDTGDGGICTGWVLIYTKAHYEDDQISYCTNYAVSPDADPARSVGIIEIGRRQILADCIGDEDDDDG